MAQSLNLTYCERSCVRIDIVGTDSAFPNINVGHHGIEIVGGPLVCRNLPMPKCCPFLVRECPNMGIHKIVNDVKRYEITVRALDTLETSSAKSSVIDLWNKTSSLNFSRSR